MKSYFSHKAKSEWSGHKPIIQKKPKPIIYIL